VISQHYNVMKYLISTLHYNFIEISAKKKMFGSYLIPNLLSNGPLYHNILFTTSYKTALTISENH
jgi:hypothetical protein